MTAEDVTISVLKMRAGKGSFTLPNYYAPGWWECDVYEVTDSGYFYEFEVKVSLADLKRDRAKARHKRSTPQENGRFHDERMAAIREGRPAPESPRETKHELLARGDPRGPSKFWFVVPAELEAGALQLMPPFAGLLVVDKPVGPFRSYAYIREPVGAPRLHLEKHGDRINQAYINGYHRYRDLYWVQHYVRMDRLANAMRVLAPEGAATEAQA